MIKAGDRTGRLQLKGGDRDLATCVALVKPSHRKKGGSSMNDVRFAAESGKTLNRLLLLTLVMAIMPAWGIGVVHADSPYAIRDKKVDPKLSPAARARSQRMAAIKKKNDLKKLVQEAAKAEQTAAPDPKAKGGAQ
jgi:hypothetical protein